VTTQEDKGVLHHAAIIKNSSSILHFYMLTQSR